MVNSVQTQTVYVYHGPNIVHIVWPDGFEVEMAVGWKFRQCVPVMKRIGGRKVEVGAICREAQIIITKGGKGVLIDGRYAEFLRKHIEWRLPGNDVYIIDLPVSVMEDIRRMAEEVYLNVLRGG